MDAMYKFSEKLLLSIILLFLFPIVINAQAPSIAWDRTIGGSGEDQLYAIQQTFDGGYILGGTAVSPVSGDKTDTSVGFFPTLDYWIVKVNATGNIEWQNDIGGTGEDRLTALQQTRDSGYIIVGYSNSNASGDKTENDQPGVSNNDIWVVKLNKLGNIVWQNSLGGIGEDKAWAIEQTFDGGYIIGAESASGISGDKTQATRGGVDYWVIKLNTVGNIVWDKAYGGTDKDQLFSIHQTSDTGYILGGVSWSPKSGDKSEENHTLGMDDYWILKINAQGNIIWQNTIGSNSVDHLSTISPTTDGGYIVAGYSDSDTSDDKTEKSNFNDYWVLKLNSTGNIQWQRTLGGLDEDWLKYAAETSDGGYILGGYSRSDISGDKTENADNYDYWIVKLNASGTMVWQKDIHANQVDYLYSMQQTKDNGYILAGSSLSRDTLDKSQNTRGSYDYWIVKLKGDSMLTTISKNYQEENIKVYPNPFHQSTTFYFGNNSKAKTLQLLDVNGKEVKTISVANKSSYELQRNQLANGLYFYVISDEADAVINRGKVTIQ